MTTEAQAKETPAPSSQPTIDVAAVAKSAAEAATKAAMADVESRASKVAADKLAEVGRALVGAPTESVHDKIVKDFVTDPLKVLRTVAQSATDNAVKIMSDSRRIEDTQRAVVGAQITEYPELNSPNKLALVERLSEQYQADGKPLSEALKLACDDTVKEFGLKSVSEAQRAGAAHYTGLPGGGGVGAGAPRRDEEKSQLDFMSNMKNRANSVRIKKVV
jgi:hypothetical protein